MTGTKKTKEAMRCREIDREKEGEREKKKEREECLIEDKLKLYKCSRLTKRERNINEINTAVAKS